MHKWIIPSQYFRDESIEVSLNIMENVVVYVQVHEIYYKAEHIDLAVKHLLSMHAKLNMTINMVAHD